MKNKLRFIPIKKPLFSRKQFTGWGDLPEAALVVVLSFLDPQDRMTARLVCYQWRRVSCALIVRRSLAPVPGDWDAITAASLAGLLRAVASIQHLSLMASHPKHLRALRAPYRLEDYLGPPCDAAPVPPAPRPRCWEVLRDLEIDFASIGVCDGWPPQTGCMTLAPGEAFGLAISMKYLQGLTALTRFRAEVPLPRVPLYRTDAWICTAVHLVAATATRLSVLEIICSDRDWVSLLPALGTLRELRDLGWVPLGWANVLLHLAALTQLTAVRAEESRGEPWGHLQGIPLALSPLAPLLEMTGLRALSLRSDSTLHQLRELMQAMTQLEELRLVQYSGEGLNLDLSPLTRLTKLDLRESNSFELFLGHFQHLVHIASCSIKPRDGAWALPRNLDHMHVLLKQYDCTTLQRSVAALTRLTSLKLVCSTTCKKWCVSRRYSARWRKATFLTGLQRLVSLELYDVLHVANARGDVACLATLTGVTRLGLSTVHPRVDHLVLEPCLFWNGWNPKWTDCPGTSWPL
eukprot:jgi/Botrbrau1/23060/Bobra.0243s0003.2